MKTVKTGDWSFTSMTVSELIEHLKTFPQDAPVFCSWEGQVKGLEPRLIVLSNTWADDGPVVFMDVD